MFGDCSFHEPKRRILDFWRLGSDLHLRVACLLQPSRLTDGRLGALGLWHLQRNHGLVPLALTFAPLPHGLGLHLDGSGGRVCPFLELRFKQQICAGDVLLLQRFKFALA